MCGPAPAKIDNLFADGNGKLLLSTIHKAKGREWDNVAILAPELSPSRWARQDWQVEQELNLIYVRDTRVRHTTITLMGA
jgi:superfamily I DNA/RNA helicase